MTEAEWLSCGDPRPMLEFLVGRTSARKLTLFTCACSRQVWHLMDARRQQAVQSNERFADGLAKIPARPTDAQAAAGAAAATADIARDAARRAEFLAAAAVRAASGRPPVPSDSVRKDEAGNPELARLAALLREVVGNPFRPIQVTAPWPPALTKLATAMEAGEDQAETMHRTLLAFGHAPLAQHFKQPGHPRGCWGIDLILGKQ